MLRIRSSENELDIEGTAEDFTRLCRAITSLLTPGAERSIEVKCDESFDPAPYANAHSSIRITVGSGPNHFDHSQQCLQVLGSLQSLKNFSDNFPAGDDDSGAIRYHYHYDHLSFPEYVSSDSPLLTLTLRSETVP
ncbi:MAG: hypothetical protein AAFY26_16170 [Cyanobacteria bacterium J06638_22]